MSTRGRRSILLVAISLTLLTATGCSVNGAKDFTLSTHDGQTFTLSEHLGSEGVVLFFFASWCEACAAQIDPIKRFVAHSDGQGVRVVGVSIQEESDTIAAYVEAREVTYPIVLDSDTSVAASYEIKGIPTIVGIDKSGKVVFRDHAMPEDAAELVKQLTQSG